MMPRSDPQNPGVPARHSFEAVHLFDAESHEFDRQGNQRYFLNNLIGFVSEGHLRRAWGSQRDITLNRQAESAIQASEARFQQRVRVGDDRYCLSGTAS